MPEPPATPGDDNWLRRYHRLRRKNIPALHAHQSATARADDAVRYRSSPGKAITLLLDDRPEKTGFTATATIDYDEDDDLSEMGEFLDKRAPDTVPAYCSVEHRYEYFRPSYTLAQRRDDFARRGYARGPAHELALAQVREDAREARDLRRHVVRVHVRKAGVLLGYADASAIAGSADDLEVVMAHAIDDYGLLNEALAEARAAIPPLLAALAA